MNSFNYLLIGFCLFQIASCCFDNSHYHKPKYDVWDSCEIVEIDYNTMEHDYKNESCVIFIIFDKHEGVKIEIKSFE